MSCWEGYSRRFDCQIDSSAAFLRKIDSRLPSVALILDIDLKLREQPAVADEVSIL
jgi:hypothetical protein